jgi:translation initiation factor 2B subunit (eIF-2B alpha/beta/delta family)
MCAVGTILPERIEELRSDREHGASWMARRAVETLAEVARETTGESDELVERLTRAGRELAASRPGIGAVAGAVGRVLAAAKRQAHLDPEQLQRVVLEEAQALIEQRTRAAASIAIQLRDRIEDSVVLTHSASATVREALLKTQPARALCTVSHPHEEGREFAAELRGAGIEADLIEDDDAPGELADVSVFLIGADTVFHDGTLCNKIGTSRLAAAAAELNVPTVVACEVIKLAPVDAADAPNLRADARELFDLTSPDLIEQVVTEEGSYATNEIAALVDRTPFLREGYALLRGTAE